MVDGLVAHVGVGIVPLIRSSSLATRVPVPICTGTAALTGCCIELVLFFFQQNRYFWRKRAKICAKRFSLEELCEKCHDMVMWTFSCCPRGSRKKFLIVPKKDLFVQKWTKHDQKKHYMQR